MRFTARLGMPLIIRRIQAGASALGTLNPSAVRLAQSVQGPLVSEADCNSPGSPVMKKDCCSSTTTGGETVPELPDSLTASDG